MTVTPKQRVTLATKRRLRAASLLAAALGCAPVVEDGALMSELSRDEFMSLCDELRDATPGPDTAVTCANGWSATVQTPSIEACTHLWYDSCPATAGDMRACADAVRRDPCAAVDSTPAACEPFYRSVCLPWITASPVQAECPAPELRQLALLEGVYELVSHTRRATSCEPGGDSVLELDRQAFVVVVASQETRGRASGTVWSCASLESCREAGRRLRDAAAGPPSLAAPELAAPELAAEGEPELQLVLGCSEAAGAFAERTLSSSAELDECRLVDTKTVASLATDGTLHLDTETWDLRREWGPNGCYFGVDARASTLGECTSLEQREGRFVWGL